MNWKFLPAALLGSMVVVAGCSASRLDPASKKKTAESADMVALKQDNDALRQDQAQSQKQIETLTKQLAADREEQRRFREMMSTNFDLLEQSVSMTLSKAIDKNGKAQATPAGAGGTPGVVASDEAPRASANPRNSASAAPRLAPVPPVGAGSAAPGGYTPLVVPNADGADEVHLASAKPAAEPPLKVRSNTQPALAASKTPAAMSASGKAPLATAATATPAAKTAAQPSARTAASLTAKPAGMPLTAALVTANAKPYQDPDLIEPANPRQLTANRAAKSLYEKGFVLFGNRQYEQSILVYQNFLSRYPDDIYSDNAQFWIGEAYLRMDKLNEAEAAYRKVLREYAHKSTLEGYKTPDAIYRIGQIFAKRANDKLAKYYLQNVAQRFPDSSAGRKAQRELDGTGPLTSQAEQGEFTTGG